MAFSREDDVRPVRDSAQAPDDGSTQVCVTGATGYLAGHIVKLLLEKGYTVRATCRDPKNEKAVGHLRNLPKAGKLLKLYQADLLTPGSFDQAVAGCTYVIHTASPYVVDCPKGQEEEMLIRPAVFGTENVINAVNKSPSVKRVVLTASTAAVFTDPHERGKGHTFTEADFNITARPNKFPYFYSKMRAEQRAYEMQEAEGCTWQLCSINPGAIWGPPLGSRLDGESINQLVQQMSGFMWPWAGKLGMGMVDVRDVAKAHYLAMVVPQASGRYLVNARSCFLLVEACRLLRQVYPRQWIPPLVGPREGTILLGPLMGLPRDLAVAMVGKVPKIDASKAARDLGMSSETYMKPEETILEMADALMSKGLVPKFVMPAAPRALGMGLVVLLVVGVLLLVLLKTLL